MIYDVELVEYRSAHILVEADDEDSAMDRAEELRATKDEVTDMLNDPNSCYDSQVNISDSDVTPDRGEKVWS